jgi:predicted GH43/DUF377 family glycosyl hydrolase
MSLPTISELGGEVIFQRRYLEPNNKGWSSFNSSVMLSNEGEYWLAFRSSNYYFVKEHDSLCFHDRSHGAKVMNKIFLVKLNKNTWQFEEETLKQIDTKSFLPFIKRDLEDPRLFWDGSNYCISATILEEGFKTAKICKVVLESLENPKVNSLEIIRPLDESTAEKNWMPITNSSNFIHSSNTLFFKHKYIELNSKNSTTKSFRGSSQVIPFDDNTNITVIHEAEHFFEDRFNSITFGTKVKVLKYSHRFVLMDNDYNIIKISDKFVLTDKEGFDFVAGMAPTDNGYVISFGRSDAACYVATISKESVEKTLKDLDV